MTKNPTKEGTVEVPDLGSRLEKSVGERHQSNHFGDLPLKERLELPLEENPEKSIEGYSVQTGAKGLEPVDESNTSSGIHTGAKGLNAADESNTSSSSQEGDKGLNDKETEAWLSNIYL